MADLNITNIPAPRVPFIDERTGLMAREWYRFFLNLFTLTGSGNNPISLEELQVGPPNQPDLTELLIQINQNIAPQYEDQSGDFLATLDTAQLMSMMARFENAEAAIQGAYLQPVVQTGTIANYNLDGSPTAGGVAYGTGPALAVSAAGTLGQVLTSGGAGAPTWATDAGGSVTSVSVVSANGLAGTVATATSTPAITLSTTITGLLKGNGTAISAAASGTDYAPATSGTSILYGNAAGGFSNVTIGTGVSFAAGTLSATGSGGTVTSVSFTGGIVTVATPTTTPALTVAGTSGGIPYFSSASAWASSAALAAGSLVLGGGAGATPATTATGTGVVTALGVNTGTAGAFVVNGGALGTPSSGSVTNLTGTASININGTVGATTATTGAFTTLSVTGITTVAAGSAAAPSIVSATGTADTGMYFPGADILGFATAGVQVGQFTAGGYLKASPDPTILFNATAATHELIGNSSSVGALRIRSQNASFAGTSVLVYVDRAANAAFNLLDLQAGGTSKVLVDGTGAVTIAGTTTAAAINASGDITASAGFMSVAADGKGFKGTYSTGVFGDSATATVTFAGCGLLLLREFQVTGAWALYGCSSDLAAMVKISSAGAGLVWTTTKDTPASVNVYQGAGGGGTGNVIIQNKTGSNKGFKVCWLLTV